MDQIIRKKPTIYDLSVLSGSSPSTVSAVLNGTWQKRRIKQTTAEAILDLAERHQYTTNLQARPCTRTVTSPRWRRHLRRTYVAEANVRLWSAGCATQSRSGAPPRR